MLPSAIMFGCGRACHIVWTVALDSVPACRHVQDLRTCRCSRARVRKKARGNLVSPRCVKTETPVNRFANVNGCGTVSAGRAFYGKSSIHVQQLFVLATIFICLPDPAGPMKRLLSRLQTLCVIRLRTSSTEIRMSHTMGVPLNTSGRAVIRSRSDNSLVMFDSSANAQYRGYRPAGETRSSAHALSGSV